MPTFAEANISNKQALDAPLNTNDSQYYDKHAVKDVKPLTLQNTESQNQFFLQKTR